MRFDFIAFAGALFALSAVSAAAGPVASDGPVAAAAAGAPALLPAQVPSGDGEGATPLRKRGVATNAGQFVDDVFAAGFKKASALSASAAARRAKLAKMPGRVLKSAKSSLSTAGSNVATFGRTAYGKVKAPVVWILTKIKEFLNGIPRKARSASSTVISKLSGIKQSSSEARKRAAAKAALALSKAKTSVGAKARKVGGAISRKVTAAGGSLSRAKQGTVDFVGGKFRQAGAVLSRAKQGTVNFVGDMAGKSRQALSVAGNNVRTSTANRLQNVADFVKPKVA